MSSTEKGGKIINNYPKVLVPAPCHKVAALIFKDIQLGLWNNPNAEPSDDLLTLLHQIASSLDQSIPAIARATHMRLTMDNAIYKAKKDHS